MKILTNACSQCSCKLNFYFVCAYNFRACQASLGFPVNRAQMALDYQDLRYRLQVLEKQMLVYTLLHRDTIPTYRL